MLVNKTQSHIFALSTRDCRRELEDGKREYISQQTKENVDWFPEKKSIKALLDQRFL